MEPTLLALLSLTLIPARTLASTDPAPAACSTALGCQAPTQAGWTMSDDNPAGGLGALDNFKVLANGSIRSVCWWGLYTDIQTFADCSPGSGDAFTIAYYDDVGCSGLPGSLRAGPFRVVPTAKFATGQVATSGAIALAEYQFEAAHPPVAVQAGECLWIQILNHTDQSCFWLWGAAAKTDGRSAQSGPFGIFPQTLDLAFCIDVATADDGCASSLATSYCTAKVNSQGCTPRLSASLQGSHLYLNAEQILPLEIGLFFYGTSGPAALPFQDGLLCVAPPVTRTAASASSAGGVPPCTGLQAFDFTALVQSGQDPGLVPGQAVWVQLWSRDPAAASGSGLSDGLAFAVCP